MIDLQDRDRSRDRKRDKEKEKEKEKDKEKDKKERKRSRSRTPKKASLLIYCLSLFLFSWPALLRKSHFLRFFLILGFVRRNMMLLMVVNAE